MTRSRPLRRTFTALVVATLASTQFALPVCAMPDEVGEDGSRDVSHAPRVLELQESRGHGTTDHSAVDADRGHEGHQDRDGMAHQGPTSHAGHGTESHAASGHPGDHHDGGSDASECLDMTACVAVALGTAPPVLALSPEAVESALPSVVEQAGLVLPRELRRPPKSI